MLAYSLYNTAFYLFGAAFLLLNAFSPPPNV